MFEKLRVIFTIPELRQKILLTLLLLAIFRVGTLIPLPIADPQRLSQFFEQAENAGFAALVNQVAMFSGTSLSQASIFGLGIMPYISASIIFQLLASVYKPLEDLQKEGEAGRKKINEYTRYFTVVLCLGQAFWYIYALDQAPPEQGIIRTGFLNDSGALGWHWYLISVLTLTAGTIFLMWLGEQIDEYGIGNGISLLIMAGILARMPSAGMELLAPLVKNGVTLGSGQGIGVEELIVLVMLFFGVVAAVVFIYQGQRRIPTQSAKHVRGRRVYGGTRQYLPLRVNQAGVMPIIFASSLLLFPSLLVGWLAGLYPAWWLQDLYQALSSSSAYLHNVMYVALIFFFCYFWVAIIFNPKDISENLKNHGSFIPGYRPGKRTADYLEKVMVRITYVGASFLALVAIAPAVVAQAASIPPVIASFYGGTSLLIAVSVAFDLVQKIDSHLVMRNYRGLLEKS